MYRDIEGSLPAPIDSSVLIAPAVSKTSVGPPGPGSVIPGLAPRAVLVTESRRRSSGPIQKTTAIVKTGDSSWLVALDKVMTFGTHDDAVH